MRRLRLSSAEDRAWLRAQREDALVDESFERTVREILDDVKARGDAAIRERTARYDGVEVPGLRLDEGSLRAAAAACPDEVRRALEEAAENIRAFHAPQLPRSFVLGGGRLEQRVVPLDVVGLYVPGGRAAYPSTVLMTAVPARTAGVRRLCLATPPARPASGGPARIPPAIAAACLIAGVDDVFLMGGAQAIGAFAFGTESVPRVDKICGPGNLFVATAKRQVAGRVGIDSFAGPSEVLIVDDGRAELRLVALDLLAQAEHDPRAIAVCVTTSEEHWQKLPDTVAAELARQQETHDNAVAHEAIARQGAVVLAASLDEAIAFANEHAPEHLEWEADPARLDEVTTAGAIFVGAFTPEPVGDYFAGPNHTLPTGGTARFASALSTTDFVRKVHVIRWDEADLRAHGPKIAALAHAEGLQAHAAAVEERLQRPAHAGVTSDDDPKAWVLASVRRQRAYTLEAPPDAPVKLNQNEGLADLPAELKRAIVGRLEDVDFRRYPPFDPSPLLDKIARADGWRKDGVLVGNGSNELLTLLFRSVLGPGERVVRPHPCFSLYPLHLDVLGAVQVPVTLSLDDDFAFPEDELVRKAASAKVVLLGSPNNPTGSVASERLLRRLLAETRALVVVDEAYRQFARQDFVPLLHDPLLRGSGRVVLLRTFSKAMGLAGLRFGYLLGHPALVEELHKVALPYNVSTLTQVAVDALLDRPEVQEDFVRRTLVERPRLAAALRAKGRRVIENGANFLLMSSASPREEFHRLLAGGVLVRDLSSAVPGFLRVSVGTPAEHERLLALIEPLEPIEHVEQPVPSNEQARATRTE